MFAQRMRLVANDPLTNTSLLLAGLALTGCASQDMSDLKDFIAEVKARPPGPLPPLPEMRQVEPYLYLAAGRRDPFRPQETVVEAPVVKPIPD